jgi:hypothetical protein
VTLNQGRRLTRDALLTTGRLNTNTTDIKGIRAAGIPDAMLMDIESIMR